MLSGRDLLHAAQVDERTYHKLISIQRGRPKADKLPVGLTMSQLGHDRIPQSHRFGRFGIPDWQFTNRHLHHDQLRLGIDEETLSMNAQEKKHSPFARQ